MTKVAASTIRVWRVLTARLTIFLYGLPCLGWVFLYEQHLKADTPREVVLASLFAPLVGLAFSLLAAAAAFRIANAQEPSDRAWHVAACSALGCYGPMAILTLMSLSATIMQMLPYGRGEYGAAHVAVTMIWFASMLGCIGTVWIGIAAAPVLIGAMLWIGVRSLVGARSAGPTDPDAGEGA